MFRSSAELLSTFQWNFELGPTLKCVSNIYFFLIDKVKTLHQDQIDFYPFFSEAAHNTERFLNFETETPWPQFASELYRPSDFLLSAKLVPASSEIIYILGFLVLTRMVMKSSVVYDVTVYSSL
jgi:hypothetical protein